MKTMVETFNELLIVGDAIIDEDRIVYLLASSSESLNTLITASENKPFCSSNGDGNRKTDTQRQKAQGSWDAK